VTLSVPSAIGWVGVVVPAHNEQQLLPACITGLRVAAAALAVPVDLLVVLDACTDGSALAASPASTLVVDVRSVGKARRAGFTQLLERRPTGMTDSQSWLATTDADTIVPSDWLVRMLSHAAAGWTAVAGTVRITDWSDHSEHVRRSWESEYDDQDHHSHVHGANLGVRADAYRRVGGMPSVAMSEDVAMVAALEEAGERVYRAGDLPVATSARRGGRTRGGFAGYLRNLADLPG
jgi:glycosyltransferase involved in cell wall biosynthesis